MEATPSTGIQTMLLGRGLRVLLSISTHRLLPALVFGYASYFYYAFLGFPYESAIGVSNARGHDSGVRSLLTTRPDLTSDQYMYRQTLKQRAVALEHLVCGM